MFVIFFRYPLELPLMLVVGFTPGTVVRPSHESQLLLWFESKVLSLG
jgi:hypothetical protein